MSALVSNLVFLVWVPASVTAGFLAALRAGVDRLIGGRSIRFERAALAAVGVGAYFLGHPLYPGLVPLIRAPTRFLFAVGGVYVAAGAYALAAGYGGRRSARSAWVGTVLAAAVGLVAAGGPGLGREILGPAGFDPQLLLVIPLAASLALGYECRANGRSGVIRTAGVVFASYALALVSAVAVTEPVRGPAGPVFAVFGLLGAVLGLPLYVLGGALADSS